MIVGNITSFAGQCSDAEHYYCNYIRVDDTYKPQPFCYLGRDLTELKRQIKQKEAEYLNHKDTWSGWKSGMTTVRFNSIQQIHETMIKKFKGHDIITYYEGKIFSEMIYIKDGKNVGKNAFGEVWDNTPNSCFKHLLPPKSEIKIKCEECGREYQLDEVTYEIEWNNQTLIQFYRKGELGNSCCKKQLLIWNVIL